MRGDEGAVAGQLLVPEAVLGADPRRHVDLVDRRPVLDPRVAPGDRLGIFGEMRRQVRVLEVAEPVRHAEMQQVEDRHDAALPHALHDLVGEAPVVAAGAEVDAVVGQAVAQVAQPHGPHEVEVLAPARVVAAFLQQVAPQPAVVDRRVGAFDAGGEHEGAVARRHLVGAAAALEAVAACRGSSARPSALRGWPRKRSAVRSASAMMVRAGLAPSALGQVELSEMYRFGTSWALPSGSTTERPGPRPSGPCR